MSVKFPRLVKMVGGAHIMLTNDRDGPFFPFWDHSKNYLSKVPTIIICVKFPIYAGSLDV